MEQTYNTPKDIFTSLDYEHYIIQYQGDIIQEVSQYKDFYVLLINDKYAIFSVKKGTDVLTEKENFASIVYLKPPELYTLQDISPITAAEINFLQLDLPLNLNGNGVIVGIVGTGIDYLNEEFMDANGDTRILYIWDQTINSNKNIEENIVPFGTLYNKTQIDEAIKAYRDGKSPYDIVPSKDDIGHSTSMSGIIGGTGKNPNFKGVVPNCKFIVIKLIEDIQHEKFFNATVPVYNITFIFIAIQLLYLYSLNNSKPMVIYFPLGTNLGSHTNADVLEQYLESISLSNGIVVVTGTGNERNEGAHASGIISEVNTNKTIELDVSPDDKNLWIEFWIDSPNVMSLDILSPSGDNSGLINALINTTDTYNFIFEKTSIKVNYYLPEEYTGDELIRVRFSDLQPGIWKFRLTANSILDGKFNAWINQSGIKSKNTFFSAPDPYGTITNPSNSNYLITAAAYNQNNNNITTYSGMAFAQNFLNIIDVAAGGVNALTIAPNNKTAIVNGTCVSAAVVAGVCAMLFQWGVVDRNFPYMYSQSIKSFLARGTSQRLGDIYPNPQWGYGILNVLKLFQNMT